MEINRLFVSLLVKSLMNHLRELLKRENMLEWFIHYIHMVIWTTYIFGSGIQDPSDPVHESGQNFLIGPVAVHSPDLTDIDLRIIWRCHDLPPKAQPT